MSASAAIASAASVQATIAAAEARSAHIETCKLTMPTYDAKTASIQQAKSYAECVNLVYPSELSHDAVLAAKAVFVIALISAAIGAYRERRHCADEILMVGFLWFLLGPVLIMSVVCIAYGIVWLFS